jgi:ethanolamine utilization protein EutN
MQIGRVVGQAVATVKHPSLSGWRLLLLQLLTADRKDDGDPVLAIDNLGARTGDLVIACSEGRAARELMNQKNSPVRWLVLGICDSWEPDGHANR